MLMVQSIDEQLDFGTLWRGIYNSLRQTARRCLEREHTSDFLRRHAEAAIWALIFCGQVRPGLVMANQEPLVFSAYDGPLSGRRNTDHY